MLKAVLFDMDDTLLDWSARSIDWITYERRHLENVRAYIAQTVQPIDRPNEFYDLVRYYSRQGWEHAEQSLTAPSYAEALHKALIEIGVPEECIDREACMHAFGWDLMDGVRPFEEVHEVLGILRQHGVQIGLVTNASVPMRFRDQELRACGLLEYFSECRFAAVDVGYLKPHPKIFQAALNCIGAQPDEAVFVGDNIEADIMGAQGVGMRAVLRLVPNGKRSDRHIVPDAVIRSLHELLPLLDVWHTGWR
ncbi:MAG: HAD family hydrolase [Anaerolineae bacterium]|nr:HAD family hydrolase [Anaerolineae bacterium]MDW8299648.1 HAD family hydrolase [Anaerolineae bacterium]